MMSEHSLGNRHGAPGINTKSLSLTHTAADLEVLKEIENIYFSEPSEFDAARYVLESVPDPPSCDSIQAMFDKLKRQQQVVSSKALHLISQQRDNCDREFNEVQIIRDEVSATLKTCREIRKELKTASNHLTVTAFVILANYRKRQIIKSVLEALELLQSLRSVEREVQELMLKKEFELAIELIIRSKKAAGLHKEYHCIKDLAVRLQEVLEMTEEKLDMVLADICHKFDERIFRKVRNAYNLLGKMQAAMEQLHMHYSNAINTTAVEAVKPYASLKDGKFQDLCNSVPLNKAPLCLLNLCENLFLIMKSYRLLVNWHMQHDTDVAAADPVAEIENSVSREYIRQKLKSGLIRLWNDVQGKVSGFLKCTGLEEYPFEKFVQMLGVLRRLTQVAEVFCGDTADVLQDFIKSQSMLYIKNYHSGRIEELRLFLENEGWEMCPVKSDFTVLNLQEFKQFKHCIRVNLDSSVSVCKSLSDGASSSHSQDDSVYIRKVFSSDCKRSPFEMFRDENISNDDIFGLESEAVDSESDEEPEELKRDFLDEDTKPMSNAVIMTNTTLSVLRNCGQYIQICRYLPQIALEVIVLMNQLFDYYFNCVHYFFTSDLEVSSNTLYSNRLNLTLKRINNSVGDGKGFASPALPEHLSMSNEADLHCLSERVVAVESVIFLAKQYEVLQPYLESIVASHQRLILNHFKENTLLICEDLRLPVYMCCASKAFDPSAILISISQIKWDMKGVAEVHSAYVDVIIRQIQIFAIRLESVREKVPLNLDVLTSIWSMVSKFVSHVLVEGFSNASKCSNGGRGLMQLDYRQLFVKIEKISRIKPLPYQDYVDRYVKAFYLPRNELEVFVRERQEYSNKHLLALVACACENKRDRQELTAVIESNN